MKKYLKDIPHLVKEYNFEKNVHINFDRLTHGSEKKVYWCCDRGHSWASMVIHRTNGSGCPYCSNKKVCEDNCIATTHPKLAKEWSSKNKIKPNEVTFGSNKKAWWKCRKGHEWESKICDKSIGTGCPYCSGRMACKNNCLSTLFPQLIEEWDYDKNEIEPTDVVGASNKKVWWKCTIGHSWQALISDRTRKDGKSTGCPYCSGNKACKDNCLSTTCPEIIKEWSSKNKIKPTEVTSKSGKIVLWKCSKGHEWSASICNRTAGNNCPYCSNKKVCEENCLATTHPKLAKEWSKKNKLKPHKITAGSDRKFWWQCKKCRWEWESQVYNRKNNRYCPRCNESKGEKLVSQVLYSLQVRYKREYKFKELGQKRFDFVLFEKYARKPYAAIEYHGQQHYVPVDFSGKNKKRAQNQFEKIQKRDKIKKQYCIDNNIKYLEIPYTKKDNIEQIIKEFIK